MPLGRQAKVLTDTQQQQALAAVASHRYPERDRVMLLLSFKAGLRAKEIAHLTWAMVTDSAGKVGDMIALQDLATKGRSGREIPMAEALRQALVEWRAVTPRPGPRDRIIFSERDPGLSPNSVRNWFALLYRRLGFQGCSSHSGRRTFITVAARKIVAAGGSLRDVQELAGHSSIQMTQRYIQGDSQAKRNVIAML
jgi:integrase/recombinase XerD